MTTPPCERTDDALLRGLVADGAKVDQHSRSFVDGARVVAVSFKDSVITREMLRHLADAECAIDLTIERCSIRDSALDVLDGIKRLHALAVTSSESNLSGLQKVHRLDGLRMLWLDARQLTTADLHFIDSAPELISVRLSGTALNDEGIRLLRDHRKLTILDVSGTRITDTGVAAIADLNQLQFLQVADCIVTDVGLQQIARLKKLRELTLAGTQVTDLGVGELANCKDLQYLNLARTGLTDEGLRRLPALYNLRTLIVDDTHVTNEGLVQLPALPNLADIFANGTRVTQGSARALGNVRVHCDAKPTSTAKRQGGD